MSDNHPKALSPEQLAALLPQYGIDSFIAQGGMGAVYKARQLSLDRDVAIKVLSAECGEDAEFRESFVTEAKAMARLNHLNLLGVFDYGDVDGMPYIVMEYVEGGSLHQAAWNQVIEPAAAVAIVKGICYGLSHAHEHNIVHRDIKPSNILLTPNAEPKVADFGLAHAVDSDETGLVMGTPGYTAPEVFHDPSQAGQLADIYSVGVILHQLLTGIDPAGSFVPPTQPTGNFRLDAIWRKATHITPAQRYPSVAAMATDLEKWVTAQQKAPVSKIGAPGQPVRRPLQSASSGGSGIGFKVFIIAILLVGVGVTYQLLQEKKKDNIIPPDTVNVVVPAQQPNPTPLPEQPVEIEPEATPDPVETVSNDTPDVTPVVENEPEPEQVPDADLPPGDPELRAKAVGLILDARKKRDKDFADNARALVSSLDASARSFDKDETVSVERLKGDIVDGMIPDTGGVHGLPASLATSFADARAKEVAILNSHRTDLTRIRDAYVTRLKGTSEVADGELKPRLLAQVERAKDLDAWISLLSPESDRTPRKSTVSFGTDGFEGKWDFNIIVGKTSKWIAYPDGRFEESNDNRKIAWRILKDETLEVDWEHRKTPFEFVRDGEGWIGKETNGIEITITRGNW